MGEKMKKFFVILILVFSLILFSQGWQKSFDGSLILSFNNYSDNWDGKESSNLNWTANGNGLFSKDLYTFLNSTNKVKLSFGQSSTKIDTLWSDFFKSSDIIDLESVERFLLNFLVDPFVSVRLESQFIDESDTLKICYINPLKFTEGLGVARLIYKKEKLEISSRFGGAFKQSINRNAIKDSITLSRGIDTRVDGGFEFVTEGFVPLREYATYTFKLNLYKALFNSKEDQLAGTPQQDYWKMVDVSFDNIVNVKIYEYISVNFNFLMLYDKEIDSKVRMKEILGIGLTYKFL